MAKPKIFYLGYSEIQYSSLKELNEKVFAIANDVLTRLNDPIVLLRVPWEEGKCDDIGYLILPEPHGCWVVYKMGRGKPRLLALSNGTRREVQHEWLSHEALRRLDPSWDLDTYQQYREVVKSWAVQYIGEDQSIVFSEELDLRRKEYLARSAEGEQL